MAQETFVIFSEHITQRPGIKVNAIGDALDIRHNVRKVPSVTLASAHTHDYYEMVYYPAGNVKYYIEGNVYLLGPGDLLVVKKAEVHTLLLEADTPYERIVVQFLPENIVGPHAEQLVDFLDNRPLGKYNHYPAALFQTSHWHWLLDRICETESDVGKHNYLTALLWQLYEGYPKLLSAETSPDDLIAKVIHYINKHLAEPLSVPLLCADFFISKPQLHRKFKKSTGLTVWEYIVTKRLHRAKELLSDGIVPADACAQSGFNDYSSFYRSYKAHFGVCPKADLYRHMSKGK